LYINDLTPLPRERGWGEAKFRLGQTWGEFMGQLTFLDYLCVKYSKYAFQSD